MLSLKQNKWCISDCHKAKIEDTRIKVIRLDF